MSRVETSLVADVDAGQFSWPHSGRSAVAPAIRSSGVVHDLGNLIQVAASALNIISRNSRIESGSDLEPVIASARISLQRAGELVEQTIRLAREDVAVGEAVSVRSCLAEIEALVKATWTSDIRFDFEVGPDLPAVTCNRLNLQSALMNLLLNARDAMPDGGVVSVRASAVHDGRVATEIELRVADTGLGMTRDTMRRATDPYFTTKPMGLGGLGLPMVMRFVQEAGGCLHIESERGVGTIVMLRLPASLTDSAMTLI